MAPRAGKVVDLAVGAALKRGMRDGLGGGSSVWLVLGAGALSVRLLQRLARPGKDSIVTEELRPGETLIITNMAKE